MKKTIMIDMDNVITDGSFLDLINEFLKTNYKLLDLNNYYLQELIDDRKEEFWNFVKEKNFYEGAELFDGCYEVLEKLNQVYDVYIVTAYLWNDTIDLSGNNLKNKYYYLREKLPFIPPEKYVFTTNKNLMYFNIRIDDKIENIEKGDVKLLMNAWHNKKLDSKYLEERGIIRVNNWYEIENILLKEVINNE